MIEQKLEEKTVLDQLVAAAEVRPRAEAAPGIVRSTAEPVNDAQVRSLYAKRVKVYPKRARGTFRTAKWAFMAFSLAVYYVIPWLRWDRGPNLPDQAVLVDFPGRRFYFFFFDLLPQELYYVTGLLVAASLALFLVTALFGRVWCGYACPQTVWTDMMVAVERFFQGDRNERMRLDKQPWSLDKAWKVGATHATWVLISLATGGTLVFYFADAPTLLRELVTGEAPIIAYLFVGLFTGTTYVLGGLAREQVCTYMCPWPRIQGAMYDRHSLIVSYRQWRGEPRGPKHKNQSWEDRGDCIDCKMCVAVCPTGIDIRNGPQLECIQCALCVDACNGIMDKVGRPRGLISYDTFVNLDAAARGGRVPIKLVRSRTLLYAVMLAATLVLMLGAWMLRSELDVGVVRDANPNYVLLSDGSIRNGYTLKLLNKQHDTRTVRITVEGLPQPRITVAGSPDPSIRIAPNETETPHVFITLSPDAVRQLAGDVTPITFVVVDTATQETSRHPSVFRYPRRP